MELLKSIKEHEGFSSKAYKDNLGILTIGYGTNIQNGISKDEAELLLIHRLNISKKEVLNFLDGEVLKYMTNEQLDALYEFNYWLGFSTFKKFKNMIKAINDVDLKKASEEMLNSKVGREYKVRTEKLAKKLRG